MAHAGRRHDRRKVLLPEARCRQCPKVTNTTIKAKQLMHLMGKQADMRLIGDMAKAGSNGKEKKHAQISFREPRI